MKVVCSGCGLLFGESSMPAHLKLHGDVEPPQSAAERIVVTVTLDGRPIFIGGPRSDSNDLFKIDNDEDGPAWLTCHLPDLSDGAVS